MNTTLSAFLLLAVPGLPLLLAFPALHSRLPWPCHIALLPALVLLAVPVVAPIDLPWLLFGTGLGIDGVSRLLLAMSVVLWAVAAPLLRAPVGDGVDNFAMTFCLLAVAGNLGAIVATDLAGFFTFSALMGYSFYGLLVVGGDGAARRAGRVYLVVMILADLALFEALLIAAATSGDLGFAAVRHAIGQSGASGLYLSMVLVGFAARAGIWPLHFWLPPAFATARPAVALLLGGVPVAIGLLGMVRWLPLGDITSHGLGLTIQGMGVAAVLYAILAGLLRAQLKLLPAYAAIITTGLFTTTVGAGFADPAAWARYANLTHLFYISLVFGLAVLVAAVGWLETRCRYPAPPAAQAGDAIPWFARRSGTVLRCCGQKGLDTWQRLRASWLVKAGALRQVHTWQRALGRSERALQRWTFAIILFLLLAIVVAFVGASSWN